MTISHLKRIKNIDLYLFEIIIKLIGQHNLILLLVFEWTSAAAQPDENDAKRK